MFGNKIKSRFWRGYLIGVALAFPVLVFLAYKVNLLVIEPYDSLALFDLENKPVAASAFDNQPLVVNYWATWCKPCLEEFPAFEAARKKAGGTTAFVMISDDSPAKIRRTLRNKHYGFIFLTTRQPLALSVRPVTYFYTADRRNSYKKIGAIDSSAFLEKLTRIQSSTR